MPYAILQSDIIGRKRGLGGARITPVESEVDQSTLGVYDKLAV